MHQKKNSKTPLIVYYIISLVVVLLLNTLLFPSIERYSVKEVEYSAFLEMLENDQIKAVEIDQTKISFTPTEQESDEKATYYTTNRVTADDKIVERLIDAEVTFGQVVPEEMSPIIEFLLSWVLPLVVFYGLGTLMFRRM
ncbi:MAG: ATP-dependent metallopeptidase FtsH/Yme1/Tma family protein, partial [Clostridia bacterium]|nr:ATP-dependent metallopeptidase FtsH/Yme1/Tma family protein [Clostridia bacterium]